MTLAIGTKLGPYEIVAPLGAGGMGEVYRASDTRLGREVAIKVLPNEVAGDAKALSRFQSEARAVAALSHPNILALFDVGEAEGVHYAVTELLQGQTLRLALADGPLAVRPALKIAAKIANALAAAHENGIVHRDLKPENVFLAPDGRVKVLDFGLARQARPPGAVDDTRSPTVTNLSGPGTVTGTVAYMSPEQARGEVVDFRSDQFSLGISLYEMLAGSRPFKAASVPEILTAIIRDEPRPLEKVAPQVPPPVRWIVERLLTKEPQGRYDSTGDLARDLATCRAHLSEATSGAVEPVSPIPSVRRRRAVLLGASAATVVGALAAAFYAGKLLSPPRLFHVERLTPSPRIISSARFLPDGRSIVYTGATGGPEAAELGELFRLRPGEPPIPLGVRGCRVLAVSASGELALVWNRESTVDGRVKATPVLAGIPAAGGAAPRLVEEDGVDIDDAQWTRDGQELIVNHHNYGDKKAQVIVFRGRPLYELPHGFMNTNFILNDHGDAIGFVETRATGNAFVTVGLDGRVIARAPMGDLFGWSIYPLRKNLVLFRAQDEHENPVQLVQLSPSGAFQRVLQNLPTDAELWDVSPAGDILITEGPKSASVREIRWLEPGADRERLLDLNFLWGASLNSSGTQLSFIVRKGARTSVILLQAGQTTPISLGEGRGFDQAPDGKTLLKVIPDSDGYYRLHLLPTGAGASRNLPGKWVNWGTSFLLNGGTVFVYGRMSDDSADHPYLLDAQASAPKRLDWHADRVEGPASPDGRTAFAAGASQGDPAVWSRVDLAGGALTPLPPRCAGMTPRGWTASGDGIWLTKPLAKDRSFPTELWRCDLKTGRTEKVREITGPDYPLAKLWRFRITPDGRSYTYIFGYDLPVRRDLFRVSGAL